MRMRPAARRNRAIGARAAAAVILAGLLAAGCGHGPAAPQRPTVQSCTTFGINALEHHITVTSLPAACRGLTRAQVNYAVGRALYAVAASVHGKAQRRARALKLSPLLAHLVSTVPAQPGSPPVPAPAAGRASGPSLRLAALISWLITVGLGTWMMARWIARGGFRRRDGAVLPPSVTFAHFGLAVAGLATWIAYLATSLAGLAWAACVLLLPVAGLGMVLVLWLPERSVETAPLPAAPLPAGPGPAPARPGRPRSGHPPVPIVAAHGVFAVATILFALLAAVGAR
jgi:manganese efflux pump family protein